MATWLDNCLMYQCYSNWYKCVEWPANLILWHLVYLLFFRKFVERDLGNRKTRASCQTVSIIRWRSLCVSNAFWLCVTKNLDQFLYPLSDKTSMVIYVYREHILQGLEDFPPSDFFEQLYISLVIPLLYHFTFYHYYIFNFISVK